MMQITDKIILLSLKIENSNDTMTIIEFSIIY